MEIPTESLSGLTIRDKIVTASEAVALIRDGDTIVVEGFAGQCFAEELTLALEERFLQSGTPRDLTLAFAVAQGNRAGRGTDRLCYEGLLKRAIGGHWGMSVELGKMAVENKIEAYNLPQGVIAQLFRDTAAGKPGLITRVGMDTFVDPRNGGGKINDKTTEDLVELISIDGEDYLFYKAFKRLDVAFLRGTTADPNGNITMEREALFLESLAIATAVHNRGGLVIVQVERIADVAVLNPKDVKIPGILVDCVVVSTPEHHSQTWGTQYSPAMSGELRVPLSSVPTLELSVRKVIARRAAMELRPNAVVNLGIGMPEGIASVAAEEHVLDYIVLTAEPGVVGGMPTGGGDFGSAINGDAILEQPPSSTSTMAAAWTRHFSAWRRPTPAAMSTSAVSAPSWRDPVGSSTSARMRRRSCSSAHSWRRAAPRSSTGTSWSPTVWPHPSSSKTSSSAPSAACTPPRPGKFRCRAHA